MGEGAIWTEYRTLKLQNFQSPTNKNAVARGPEATKHPNGGSPDTCKIKNDNMPKRN